MPGSTEPASVSEAAPVPASDRLRERTLWFASAALFLPVVALYLFAHWYPAAGRDLQPTGFLQGDMPSYLANAREFFDENGRFVLYANPYETVENPPAIYFQPHIFVLGVVERVTRLDPGIIAVLFGFVAGIACIRIALALFERVAGLRTSTQWIGAVVFVWGGGVLAILGLITGPTHERWMLLKAWPAILRFDPGDGWWSLNLGRNLVNPMEAYYHAVFLATVVAVIARRWRPALVLAIVLSASHPFTGVQLLLVLVSWVAIERYFLGDETVARWFLPGLAAALVAHLGYYLVLLPSFETHAAILEQWQKEWEYTASQFVPAYLLAGGLVFWAARRIDLARTVFAEAANRLFLVWAIVSFLLANHEFAIKEPIQPIHFAHGYVWMPLYLLGAGVFVALLDRLRARGAIGMVAVGLVVILFLSDNVLWFGRHVANGVVRGEVLGFTLSRDQRAVLQWMDNLDSDRALVISQDFDFGYLVPTYTPFHAWAGHVYNEPEGWQRRAQVAEFFQTRVAPPEWRATTTYVVSGKVDRLFMDSWFLGTKVYENDSHSVYRLSGGRAEDGRTR